MREEASRRPCFARSQLPVTRQQISGTSLPGSSLGSVLGVCSASCGFWLRGGRGLQRAAGSRGAAVGGAENPRHRDFPVCREGQQGPTAGLDAHRPDPAPAKPRLPQSQPCPHRVPGLPSLPHPCCWCSLPPSFPCLAAAAAAPRRTETSLLPTEASLLPSPLPSLLPTVPTVLPAAPTPRHHLPAALRWQAQLGLPLPAHPAAPRAVPTLPSPPPCFCLSQLKTKARRFSPWPS